jgi:hypothetical protein
VQAHFRDAWVLMNSKFTQNTSEHASGLVALTVYRRQLGRSKATIWRYRRNNWLKTVNVLGKLYVTRESIAEFEAMMLSGELAKEPHGCAALQAAA